MAITAYFYQFEKKVNSTKQPITPIVGDFAVTVELKNVTNLFTPSLVISADRFTSGGALTNPMKFIYCELSDFNRYYFVRSWSWVLGRWECSLEIDVLASFKTEIGNTTAYILRAASGANPDIIDTKYTTKSDAKCSFNQIPTIWKTNLHSSSVSDGFFVIGIVNNDTNAVGATSYYACSGQVLRRFISSLYASPSWMNITDATISNDLQKMLMNPIQYITSCQWVPLGMSAAAQSALTSITSVPVGWWSMSLSAGDVFYKISSAYLTANFAYDFALPKHSQATGNLKWLQNSPYSVYQMQFYPFGVFPLDASKLYGYPGIRCYVEVDIITGSAILSVFRKNPDNTIANGLVYTATAQLTIPISLAQMSVDLSRVQNTTTLALSAGLALASDTQATSDLVNSAKTFVGAAVPDFGNSYDDYMYKLGEWYGNGRKGPRPTIGGSIVTDDYKEAVTTSGASLLSSVGKVALNIGNAVLASSGTCKTQGVNGALAQYNLPQRVECFYYEIVQTDPTHYGMPYCNSAKISNFSGFVMCANEGNLSVNCTQVERQAIVAAMTAGFYYE